MSEEQAQTQTPLARLLTERIRREGPIPVADYMRLCLYDPEHGYYRHSLAIGAAADFITAPEISQIFGELIGLWCGVAWQQMGQPGQLNLVELGPGRGTMMQDALRASRAVPGFRETIRVHLIESNPVLAAVQRATLEAEVAQIEWHDSPAALPPGPTIVLANEFLDALPVEQAVFHERRWYRRGVGLGEHGLTFCLCEALPDAGAEVPRENGAGEGAIVEFRPDIEQYIVPFLRDRARQAPLAALFIDYGHLRSGFGDTLQAVARQRPVSPLLAPGESDLTAQVDFEQLARCASATAADEPGLAVDGPVTQAEFLGYLGVVERASRLMSANPGNAAQIEAAVARLLAPAGMGSRYKAIGIRSPHLPPLPGLIVAADPPPAA